MYRQLLDEDAVTELVARAQGGDMQARDELLTCFTPLVQATAARYGRRNREDAAQEASLAFLTAVTSFNPQLGIPFSGYARSRVRGEVRTAMRRLWNHDRHCLHSRGGTVDSSGIELWDLVLAGSSTSLGMKRSPGLSSSWTTGGGWEGDLRLDPLAVRGDDGRLGYGAVEVAHWLAVTPLSPRERLAVLGLMAGWTVGEIAQSAGVGTETVKTWRKRALHKLRKTL